MKRQSLKLHFLFFFLLISLFSIAQKKQTEKIIIDTSLIIGNWVNEEIDSAFGHKLVFEFSFIRGANFILEIKLDGKLKEKYQRRFKINGSNKLILEITNKKTTTFEIYELTKEYIKMKSENANKLLTLIKS